MLEIKTYQIIETGELVKISEFSFRSFDIVNKHVYAAYNRGSWGMRDLRFQYAGRLRYSDIELISIYALLRK